MTFSSNQSQNTNQLPISLDVNPGEPGYESILQEYLRRVANASNTKSSGLHLLQETGNFEQWFSYDASGNPNPQQTRSAFRLTIDAVALNSAALPNGVTTLTLTSSTLPVKPDDYLYPIQGYGGAVDANGISYFLSDPNVSFTYETATGNLVIDNNTGVDLEWCVVVLEYLKN